MLFQHILGTNVKVEETQEHIHQIFNKYKRHDYFYHGSLISKLRQVHLSE